MNSKRFFGCAVLLTLVSMASFAGEDRQRMPPPITNEPVIGTIVTGPIVEVPPCWRGNRPCPKPLSAAVGAGSSQRMGDRPLTCGRAGNDNRPCPRPARG